MKMEMFNIKLFIVALIVFLCLNNIRTKTTHTITDVQSDIVATDFHFDSIASCIDFNMYTLTVPQLMMNTFIFNEYTICQKEIERNIISLNLVTYVTYKFNTS